jgi:integral membrane protein
VISTFRTVAYVEALSFLALLVASFVKRATEGPDLVPVLGPIHGVIFVVYVILVLKVRAGQDWGLGRTILVIIASALPFGGFFVGRDLKEPESAHGS